VTTTEPSVTRTPSRTGYTTDTREIPLDITGAPDLTTGMKTFAPARAKLVFRRSYRDGSEPRWSEWLVRVHVSGPRRLSSGALSDRSTVSATYRPDAAPGSMYAPPPYLLTAVADWHPDTFEATRLRDAARETNR
jgi:hypothetical protein